jgi:hypothetical protein
MFGHCRLDADLGGLYTVEARMELVEGVGERRGGLGA